VDNSSASEPSCHPDGLFVKTEHGLCIIKIQITAALFEKFEFYVLAASKLAVTL